VVLKGDNSTGEFYSIAVTNNPQADTGTKMIHLGKTLNQRLFQREFLPEDLKIVTVVLVRISPNADNARNFSQCDFVNGNNCGAHTFFIDQ
jgi:Fe-S cluster assembly protein SufB